MAYASTLRSFVGVAHTSGVRNLGPHPDSAMTIGAGGLQNATCRGQYSSRAATCMRRQALASVRSVTSYGCCRGFLTPALKMQKRRPWGVVLGNAKNASDKLGLSDVSMATTSCRHVLFGRQTRNSRATRAVTMAVSPAEIYTLAVDVVLPRPITIVESTWELSDHLIKTCYMLYACLFSWGCVVFASMNDPFYDDEEYRNAGGDGTGNWIYEEQDKLELANREALWRDELIKEIEEKEEELNRLP